MSLPSLRIRRHRQACGSGAGRAARCLMTTETPKPQNEPLLPLELVVLVLFAIFTLVLFAGNGVLW